MLPFNLNHLIRRSVRGLLKPLYPEANPHLKDLAKIPFKHLSAGGKVQVDSLGIPHIRGKSWQDCFSLQGFFHAKDRFFQMDLMRRVITGRLAEIIGAKPLDKPLIYLLKGKTIADIDRFMRVFQLDRATEESLKVASDQSLEMLHAYAAGINHFLALGKKYLPLEIRLLGYEPEPWTPFDTMLVSRAMAFELNMSWRSHIVYPLLESRAQEKDFPLRSEEHTSELQSH